MSYTELSRYAADAALLLLVAALIVRGVYSLLHKPQRDLPSLDRDEAACVVLAVTLYAANLRDGLAAAAQATDWGKITTEREAAERQQARDSFRAMQARCLAIRDRLCQEHPGLARPLVFGLDEMAPAEHP